MTAHPPFYVQAVSILNSAIFGSFAIRNLFQPGKGIPFIPNDDNSQLFYFGVGPDEMTRGQICYTSLLGHMILVAIAAKIATVFSATSEGTFLRRNLLLAMGVSELIMAISLFIRFEEDLNDAGTSYKGLSILMSLEGSIFVYDAIFRPRPVKKGKNN